MCAGLWCLVEGDTSCKTKLDPPLDGTECGSDKVTTLSVHLGHDYIIIGPLILLIADSSLVQVKSGAKCEMSWKAARMTSSLISSYLWLCAVILLDSVIKVLFMTHFVVYCVVFVCVWGCVCVFPIGREKPCLLFIYQLGLVSNTQTEQTEGASKVCIVMLNHTELSHAFILSRTFSLLQSTRYLESAQMP